MCNQVVFGTTDMITLREYAKRNNVSYEAVRKQVVRYKLELDGHISKIKKTQYLDDDAVKFLDSKRQENPIIIQEADRSERIEQLEAENKILLLKVAELQEALIQEKDQVKLLQTEKIALLEAKNERRGLFDRIFGKR